MLWSVCFTWSVGPLVCNGAEITATTAANVLVEFTFTSKLDRDDPFNQVVLDALFTDPAGKQLRVPGFWAGGNTWKVRYASPQIGKHRFRTECSDAKDPGLHAVKGSVDIEPYKGENPLYLHGPLRVRRLASLPRTRRRHALLLARRHLVDGPVPSPGLAG